MNKYEKALRVFGELINDTHTEQFYEEEYEDLEELIDNYGTLDKALDKAIERLIITTELYSRELGLNDKDIGESLYDRKKWKEWLMRNEKTD